MTTYLGPDGLPRYGWSRAAPQFLAYHDTEWGYPVSEDRRLFKKLSLEAMRPVENPLA
jgi:DNA-3-methyladenine glycosylase I